MNNTVRNGGHMCVTEGHRGCVFQRSCKCLSREIKSHHSFHLVLLLLLTYTTPLNTQTHTHTHAHTSAAVSCCCAQRSDTIQPFDFSPHHIRQTIFIIINIMYALPLLPITPNISSLCVCVCATPTGHRR